ncbi:MAG TPA: isocitrate/isopropylmalate dehydrogenase family protein [Anaerolineaceae bacterium]
MPTLVVIPGDGIGLEVIPAAVRVLQTAIPGLEIIEKEAGWGCFQKHGISVPADTLEAIRSVKAALFGAVSSPAYKVEGYRSAIITLRQELDLYANLRPVHSLPRVSPRPGVDLIIVRENTEGLYAGRERRDGDTAIAERVITREASRHIAEKTFQLARSLHRRRVTIVHKANILPITDGLFRDTVRAVGAAFIAAHGLFVEIDELLVDVAAYRLAAEPESLDMIVTTNLFGDILSDEAAAWGGGMGLAPSINLGDSLTLAEPVHGSAPDIAGKGIANPIASILSAALLARHAWDLPDVASAIEKSVEACLNQGIGATPRAALLPGETERITRAVIDHLK